MSLEINTSDTYYIRLIIHLIVIVCESDWCIPLPDCHRPTESHGFLNHFMPPCSLQNNCGTCVFYESDTH